MSERHRPDHRHDLPRALRIGQAAERSGVSSKMIRYYESAGVIGGVARSDSNYRVYSDEDVQKLRFVARGRELGFSMEDIVELLRLWSEPGRSSADVKAVALKHLSALNRKIEALRSMQRAVKHLTDHCHGDDRPDCPILDDLGAAPSRKGKLS